MEERKLGTIRYVVGIDIAKATFNYCIRYGEGQVINEKVANHLELINEFILMLKDLTGCKINYIVFGMEATGIYGNLLIEILCKV
ncbi:hypothetical protein ACEN2P_00235 [Pedobacter psychrotolerans]|uniref:hypothetical protein n=1 Tax=Pedobacter psychrotolerans TaxID=1843235 RepID=UPI003F996846